MTTVGAMTTSRIEEALHNKSGEKRVTDFEDISNMDVAPEPYMDVLERRASKIVTRFSPY